MFFREAKNAIINVKIDVKRMFCILLGCILFWVLYPIIVYNVPITQIYAPSTIWNDDVIYYKQLSAVISQGYPRGYFGYNESCADIGSFGAWGPILFYIYALPALFFGICPNMVWICNIILVTLGWFVFVQCTHITWKKQIIFALGFTLMQLPVRYVYSGMSEAVSYALILMIVGLAYYMYHNEQKNPLWLCVPCFVLTLLRIYGIVFWIFPLSLLVIKKKRKQAIYCFVTAAANLLISLILLVKFCAPYTNSSVSSINADIVNLFIKGKFVEGIQSVVNLFSVGISKIILYIKEGLVQGQGLAELVYLIVPVMLLINIVYIVIDWRKGEEVYLKLCILFCAISVLMAVITLYDIWAGSRHMLILCIGLLGVFCIEKSKRGIILLCGLGIICFLVRYEEERYPMIYDSEYAYKINYYQELLDDKIQIDKTERISWDNTIGYDANVDFCWLWCVPDGMGIQYDFMLADNDWEIQSQYAMVLEGSSAEKRLISDGWELLIQTEDFVIYEQ